jgi:hypothetical protein
LADLIEKLVQHRRLVNIALAASERYTVAILVAAK